jgi:hypothetical protein
MTKIQLLTKFAGTLILMLFNIYLMRVKGIDLVQLFSFLMLYFMWFDGWNVYTERSRRKMDNGA